jgi:hypothetical protein
VGWHASLNGEALPLGLALFVLGVILAGVWLWRQR